MPVKEQMWITLSGGELDVFFHLRILTLNLFFILKYFNQISQNLGGVKGASTIMSSTSPS